MAWSEGHQAALETLTPFVHEELRRLAHHYMKGERPGHTLQTTALVNEAYLKLIDQKRVKFKNRSQFFALAATLMRHILVDHARKHTAGKRDHGASLLSLDDAVDLAAARNIDLVALDDALVGLAALDKEQSKIVELRFFGGLTIKEIAEMLEISEITVSRKWKTARLWLHHQVSRNEPDES